MKYDRKKALNIILDAAKNYKDKLCDFHFKIVCLKNGKQEYAYIGFRDNNFLHLTGVKSKLSAQRFYEASLNGKLSLYDFEIDKQGKVQRKLEVLPYLHDLLYNSCMIGDFINSGIVIKSDYFVGNTRAMLSVGFRYGKSTDIPVSLYNEDIRKLTKPTCKVLLIQRKLYNEKEYTYITYLAKDYELRNGNLVKIAR